MSLPFVISFEREDPKVLRIVESSFSFLERLSNVKIPRSYDVTRSRGKLYANTNFSSVQWYAKTALNMERRQANSSILWQLFESEPWQRNRHYELMILETDLYANGTNFIFGETRPKIFNNGTIFDDNYVGGRPFITGLVLSINMIKKHYANWGDAFHSILLHEEGHFYGLPSASNPDYMRRNDRRAKSELDYGHCNNRDCIMEQVNVPGRMDLNRKAEHINRANPSFFCEYDLEALRNNIRRLYNQ